MGISAMNAINNSITAFENRCEREYQDQLELQEALADYHDELREELDDLLNEHCSFELSEMYKLADAVKEMARRIRQREEPTP